MDDGWFIYCLESENGRRTYVGATNNLPRRLRKHNGEISGGARATRSGRPWHFIAHSCQPMSKRLALSLERCWKNSSRAKELKKLRPKERRLQAAQRVVDQKVVSGSLSECSSCEMCTPNTA